MDIVTVIDHTVTENKNYQAQVGNFIVVINSLLYDMHVCCAIKKIHVYLFLVKIQNYFT